MAALFGRFNQLFGIKKCQFRRDRILVPAGDFFSGIDQGQRQTELGADTIPIGPNMPDHADRLAFLDRLYDAVNYLGMDLHL